MLPFSNTVAPALVKPFSSNDTIVPDIVRLRLSAAVSVIGKLIFNVLLIGSSPPPLVFAQRSLRQRDLGFHKLAHALMQIHARNRQCQI